MKRVVVVGGGVAGLALAHALKQRRADGDLDVIVLEKAARPGGNIRSERIDGYLCEWGPNGFLDNVPETLSLVRALGLQARIQASDAVARRRYIYRSDRLHPLPGGPVGFLRSGLLSSRGKLRIAFEPLARRRPDVDETIHAFAARRIGREAADILIDAMVSGVFAGDARALSLRACFPKMWQMETDHGGLFRALLAKRKERRRGDAIGSPLGTLTSFRDGLEELIHALAASLGPALRTGRPVSGLRPHRGRYVVECSPGEAIEADAVVLAAGPASTARVVAPFDGALAAVLDEIPSAPLAVVCLGYDESKLPRPLDGFGFLVPHGEGPRILGVLWDSSIYPGRAPHGRVLLRAMIGGAHDPGAIGLSDDALLDAVLRDLGATLGLRIPPDFVRIFRHPLGIPQYTVGHVDRLSRIDIILARHPGLHVAGNGYRGVAINSCVAEADVLAGRVLASLEPAGSAPMVA